MDVSQLVFIIQGLLIGILIAVGYWYEKGLIGIYIGWLLGVLSGIWLNELIVGLAGSLL